MTVAQFEALLEQYGDSIFGFCFHLTGHKESAEDLYQDSVLTAFGKLEAIDGSTPEGLDNARKYIIGIAAKLYKNMKRKRYNSRRHPDNDAIMDTWSDRTNIAAETEQKDISAEIRRIVKNLPDKQRIVTYLYYFADMSVADISKQMKMPPGTIKSRLNRARMLIKTELEEMNYG